MERKATLRKAGTGPGDLEEEAGVEDLWDRGGLEGRGWEVTAFPW